MRLLNGRLEDEVRSGRRVRVQAGHGGKEQE